MEFRAAQAPDPFADLLGPGPSAPASGGIPDDFSDLGIPKGGAPSSIDALFGLDSTTRGSDPFANSLLADPLSQPNTATASDPLAALQNVAKPTGAAHGNHVSMLNQAFVAPTASPAATLPSSASRPDVVLDDFSDLLGPQTTPQAAPSSTQKPAVNLPSAQALPDLVLDDFSDLLGPQTTPPAAPVVTAPTPALAAAAPTLPPQPCLDPVTIAPSAPARAAPTAPAGPSVAARAAVGQASDSELLAAFLRGVDSNHQMPVALTPGLMERIGGMLRSATEGTVHLLLTRQEIKREVHAAVTMIGSQNNNPLKFSPTVEVALGHLLGPNIKGFMPAPEAMRDAFNDLRAHQLGVMVGMQAAMDHMLSRFTPEALEKRIAEKSALDSLFSASRKAKLWDQFCALHASILEETKEDSNKLFGEAFSKAYDEQMNRLKAQSGKR
jgi:FHA domain-containing protein